MHAAQPDARSHSSPAQSGQAQSGQGHVGQGSTGPAHGPEAEAALAEASATCSRLVEAIDRVIVGQRPLIDRLLIGLVSDGHVLLEGVPGLAKTLTLSTLARAIRGVFSRIQFTPDLLPADLIGTLIYNPRDGTFTPRKGPIFANIVLADEINRAPAKVQSALLEAMQERQVTLGDATHRLDDPFLVLATQNPIEHEGTYPLPEAQVDRFMLKVMVGYPTRDEEVEIVSRVAVAAPAPAADPVATPEDIRRARAAAGLVYVDPKVRRYAVDLVSATRRPGDVGLDLARFIEFGASPRGSINLVRAARAHAFIRGRAFVTPADVKAVAPDVLRHRLVLSYEAQAELVTTDSIVARVLDAVRVP